MMRRLTQVWQLWSMTLYYAMHALILWIFFCGTWWWRPRWVLADWMPSFWRENLLMPSTSPDYLSVYYARFALTLFIVALVGLWVLSGFRGLRQLALDGRMYWLFTLAALMVLTRLSVSWATQSTAVANSHAMQWLLMSLFVLVVSAVAPAPRWVIGAMLAGLVVHGSIGIAQVAEQKAIELSRIDEDYLHLGIGLSEFYLNPNQSGTSVIQSNGVRYLRAYGITPHPNLLAGSLTMALVVGLAGWYHTRRAWLMGLLTIGLWALLLTFSRASLGGLVVGVAVTVGLWWLNGERNKYIVGQIGLWLALVGGVFFIVYQDLVLARAGVAAEGGTMSVEQRSLSDRQVYLDQAQIIIKKYPVRGVGIGNFPWESHVMLRNDPRGFDLQGDNVHNIYFLLVSELGIIGAVLVGLNGIIAGGLAFNYWRGGQFTPEMAGLWGGVVAWLAIGWFEAYPWSLFTHQVLLWGVMAVALLPPPPKDAEANAGNSLR